MILIEKQQKYLLYHQEKLISLNILLGKKYYHLINNKIIEQAKFTYSPLGKIFEKQTKTIEDQGEKQIKAINESSIKKYIPENILNDEAKKELDKISEIKKDVDREKLVYKTNIHTCDFQTFQTIRTFARDIYNGEISLEEANEDQKKLFDEILYFN